MAHHVSGRRQSSCRWKDTGALVRTPVVPPEIAQSGQLPRPCRMWCIGEWRQDACRAAASRARSRSRLANMSLRDLPTCSPTSWPSRLTMSPPNALGQILRLCFAMLLALAPISTNASTFEPALNPLQPSPEAIYPRKTALKTRRYGGGGARTGLLFTNGAPAERAVSDRVVLANPSTLRSRMANYSAPCLSESH
jgi:hypothetical protein